MKLKISFSFWMLLLSSLTAFAQLSVVNVPTGAAVVVTQPSAVFVTWNLQAAPNSASSAVSEEGLFVLGDRVLGRVSTFLTTPIGPGGNGSATETLLIPPDISNQALKLNARSFFYRRTFRTNSGASGQSALTCRLSTSAYGNFSIAAVTLFYENHRGEATFDQNDTKAHAYAEVHYNGTGLLKAVWEVEEPNNPDFRVLQQVNYHITYGDRIVFESPSIPPLPTILTGRHILRFRILEPISGFEIPPITYFVKVHDTNAAPAARLELLTPPAGAKVANEVVFEWSGAVPPEAIQKLSVHERATLGSILPVSPSVEALPDSNQLSSSKIFQATELSPIEGVSIFSAALPSGSHVFKPRPEQLQRLRPGVPYVWEVQALDGSGNVIAQSELRFFELEAPKAPEPNHQ